MAISLPTKEESHLVETITTEELRKFKLFVATPQYGGMCTGMYAKSCLDLQSHLSSLGVESRFSFLFNESLITRARNYLVDEFLRSDCTHLLFLDSDINFNPRNIVELLALDYNVVGAPYPKKSIKWASVLKAIEKAKHNNRVLSAEDLNEVIGDYVFNPVPGTKEFQVHKPLEVLELGTGYMLVKREVFESFAEAYPHLKYRPDHAGQANFDGTRYIHAYFDTVIDPQSHRYLSEDYMFCQYWRNIGGQVWLCPWMPTMHVGTLAFPGNLQKVAELTGSL